MIKDKLLALRKHSGMSQQEVAVAIGVTRQTVRNWENSKTYPDVQSLLILSEVFDTSIDDLVKGDVETMNETIDRDSRTLLRLGFIMLAFLLLMIAALVWLSVQLVVWDWPMAQTAPTLVLALVLWGIAMAAAVWAERIKKEHDLVTYSEVLAFFKDEPVNRDTPCGKRERVIPRWMKIIRTIGWMLIAAAVGAFIGYNGAALMDMVLG